MKGILADVNIQGQVTALFHVLRSESWREFWSLVDVPLLTFPDVGLAHDASDRAVWELCQREGLVLVTGNRNADGPDSLEVTLRTLNTPACLPVFTISDIHGVQHSKHYAERAAAKLLDYLLTIDNYRGTGRLYLP